MNKQQLAALAKKREMDYNEQLQDVRELELKSRFWKAQWEIRYYTLEAEKLQLSYDEYVDAQRKKNELAMKEYQEMMEKISQQEKEKAEETFSDMKPNPELAHGEVTDLTPKEFLTENPN